MQILEEVEPLATKDLIIYLYPNQHGGSVFVKSNGNGLGPNLPTKVRTGLKLPPWVVQNTLKILGQKRKLEDDSTQALEAETLRRKQEEKMLRLTDDIKVIKKDFDSIKHDIQIIASRLKNSQ